MQTLQAGFEENSGRTVLRLRADLGAGWSKLNGAWGFDHEDCVPYERESTFVCRVRLRPTKGLRISERLLQSFPEFDPLEISLASWSFSMESSILTIRVPLADQKWVPTKNLNRYPSIYVFEDPLFERDLDGENVRYSMQMWIRLRGPSKMFVKTEFDWGDGFAWIGGRPESNRRKF